jgi:RimJ/RimL family protein N-acetyltransferase
MQQALGTERLRLVRLTRADAEALCYGGEPPGLGAARPAQDYLPLAFGVRLLAQGEDVEAWAIIRVEDDTIIGDVNLQQERWHPENLWLSYQVAKSAQGRGYAKEAVLAVVEDAMQRPHVRSVRAEIYDTGIASERVAKAAGLVPLVRRPSARIWERSRRR